MNEVETQLIKQLEIFSNLNDESIETILNLGLVIELNPDIYLFYENDEIDYFYIVLSGSLGVIKKHQTTGTEFEINQILPGKCIGEVGIAGQQFRTATIKTLEKTSLFRCPINQLRYLIYNKYEQMHPYLSLIQKLNGVMLERLQYMNQGKVTAMQDQITYLNEKLKMSIFMVSTISILCVYVLIVQGLILLMKIASDSTYITLPIMIVLVTIISRLSVKIGFTLKDLGITTKNWQRATYEAIAYTIPILIVLTLSKIIIIKIIPHFSNLPVFDMQENAIIVLCYLFIIVPIQELLCRGILQGSLNRFLTSKNKEWHAIIISNLMFSAFHTFISPFFAILSFISGIYFGWLYARNQTLISPCIAHGIVGFWALSVINILRLLQ